MKKILFISSIKGMWPFVENLCSKLAPLGYNIHILDFDDHILVEYNSGNIINKIKYIKTPPKFALWKLYLLWKKFVAYQYILFLKKLIHSYDATLILYHDSKLNTLANAISETSERLVISYAGSDFYTVNNKTKTENKLLLNKADTIAFNNPYMSHDFIDYYKIYNSKIRITGFGLSNLELIKKIKVQERIIDSKSILGIPNDKIIVSLGYNGDFKHRHLDFLCLLESVSPEIRKNLFFLFPMTYCKNEDYISLVKNKVTELNINCKIFDVLLTDEDICRVRIVTDIAIHIAKSDQASGSMLEHLFSGNVVIAGNWLPYQFWDDLNIYSHRIAEKNLIHTFISVYENLEEEKINSQINSEIVYKNYSWENQIKKWTDIL